MHLYVITHQAPDGRYYTSFQNNDGKVLAESCYYSSEEACRKGQEELLELLRQRARAGGYPTPYLCAGYYYCCLVRGKDNIILRSGTSDTKSGSLKIWRELMECVQGRIHHYDHTREKDSLTLHFDPAVMSYMYSLDNQGRENILNYTTEVQWENPDSWLWDKKQNRMLDVYDRLFQRMPRSHETQYRIELRTGDKPYSDTNAAVYLTLTGEKATSQEFRLGSTGQNFRVSGQDVFLVTAREDLGELRSLRIRHDNSGTLAEWYLKDIRVSRERRGGSWYFPCDRWLYVQQGDKHNDLTLPVGIAPGCEHRYTLRFRSGSVAVDSGTDANVFVTLHGTKGSSQEYKLNSLLAHFDKGGDDTIDLTVNKALGQLERLTVRHDNSGPCPSWYLRDVRVENKTTGEGWLFPCERWLAVNKEDGLTQWTLVAGPSGENEFVYAVRIQTGHALTAGTDAKVFITLHGAKGSSQEFRLNNSGNDFETGKLDTFRLCVTEDLGELERVRIRHSNFGLLSGWYLDHIRIQQLGTDNAWYVPCDRWLDKQKDDGSIDRTLDAIAEGQKEARYRVITRTGDVTNGGTNAKVFITLHGTEGSSPEFRLDDTGSDFRKGKTDFFLITLARELGQLESIRIRHNNAGLFPGWYLEEVRVELVDTEQCWLFPCGRWLDKKKDDGSIDLTLPVEKGGAKA